MDEKDEEKTKRKRPDRAEKLKLQKGTSHIVVKSCLKKYLVGNDKKKILEAIDKRVISFSKRMRAASLALATIIKIEAQKVEDVRNITLPDFLDQTFLRLLLIGPDRARGEKVPEYLEKFSQNHPELFQNIERNSGDRNIFSNGATKLLTNLKNHFKTNLIKKIKTFKNSLTKPPFQFTKDMSNKVLFLITGWDVPENLQNIYLPEFIVKEVQYHRSILNVQESITDEWLDDSSNHLNILRYFIHLNSLRADLGQKLFSLIPISHIRNHYITIDCHSLYGLMKDLAYVSCNKDTFLESAFDHWGSIFRFEKLMTVSGARSFTGTLETDGVGASCHFLKPKLPNKGSKTTFNPQEDSKKRQIGVDPGRNPNIITAAEKLEDGTYKHWKLTRKQYYNDSGIFKAREQTQKWQKCIQEVLNEFTVVSLKGNNLDNHLVYLEVYNKHKEILWEEYTKKKWSRQRLSLYGGKRRVVETFFNKIKSFNPKKQVVVAYGSSKFASGGKGEISVPTTSMFKSFSRTFKTIPTCEFRTTFVHHETDELLRVVGTQKDRKKSLHDLLWYESTSDKNRSKFVSRDFNASINILRCIDSSKRPLSLSRTPGLQAIDKRIFKIIKW